MEPQDFHSVDPQDLAKITIADILEGGGPDSEELDYNVQVPTTNQRIPRKQQDAWWEVETGALDPDALPGLDNGLRGRIGGC